MKAKKSKENKSKENKNKSVITQWLIPVLVLLFIVVLLLINFSISTRKEAKENVEEHLLNVTEQYASKVHMELDGMTKAGLPLSSMLPEFWDRFHDKEFVTKMLLELQQNSAAYMVVAADLEGNAITESGYSRNISSEDFFQQASSVSQKYIYTEEGLRERDAVISAIPIQKQKNTIGYLFLFYPEERFRDLIRKVEFDNLSFYAIVTEDGSIIEGVGTPTAFLGEENLLDILQKSVIYEDSFEKTKLRLSKLSSGIIGAAYQGERRKIVYAPFEINTWHMVIGVNQSYVDREEENESSMTHAMIWKLVAALGIFFGMIMVMNIISKIRTEERGRMLENKADTDLLTELNNKIATERKIREYMKEQPGQCAMMFVLDVDNFKKINDTMGHAFGDEVLRTLGLRLKSEFRVSDIIGRTGGDEFIIFLKNIKDKETVAREVAQVERLFKDFKAGEYVKYSVTASIGCALYPSDADSFEDLYKAADKALYKAKRRGKNQIALYTEEDASIDLEAEKRKSRS